MTIDEAIKLLTDLDREDDREYDDEDLDAIKLGVEAMKAVKECRASQMLCPGMLMPGETEE